MKVKELVKELLKQDQEKEVVVNDDGMISIFIEIKESYEWENTVEIIGL